MFLDTILRNFLGILGQFHGNSLRNSRGIFSRIRAEFSRIFRNFWGGFWEEFSWEFWWGSQVEFQENFLGFWEILLGISGWNFGILKNSGNFSGILKEFFGNSRRFLEGFGEEFWGVLREFSWNFWGIWSKFLGIFEWNFQGNFQDFGENSREFPAPFGVEFSRILGGFGVGFSGEFSGNFLEFGGNF